MKPLSYQRVLRHARAINYLGYRIPKKINTRIIILVSGYFGAIIGLVDAREFRALDVSYIFFSRDAFPPNSYSVEWATNSWSLIHQIGYLGFSSGFDHRQMSLAISAVTGAAMVIGLALLIYSITRNGLVAILAAPLFARFPVTRLFEADYHALYIGSEHLGWLGSSFALLTLGVASAGLFRSAGFIAMLGAAIHLIFGAWSAVILGCLMAALFFQKRFDNVFAILKGLSAGALLLIASYLVDQFFIVTKSEFPADDTALPVWSEKWEYHRNVGFDIPAIVLACVFAAIALWFIRIERRRVGNYDYTAALILFFPFVVSPLLYIAGHADLAALSEILVRVIPGRFMSLNTFFALIVIVWFVFRFEFFGIRGRYFLQSGLIILLCFALTALLCFALTVLLVSFLPLYAIPVVVAYTAAMAVYLRKSNSPQAARIKSWARPFFHALSSATAVFVFAGAILLAAYSGAGSARMPSIDDGAECKDIAVEGLVLVASFGQYIISERRCALPALLDPWSANSLPYVPWAAGEMRRIISVGYGVDFENPPAATRATGAIREDAFRQVWEARNGAEWARVADAFGLGAVMVPSDWSLDLGPPIAEGEKFKLYSVR